MIGYLEGTVRASTLGGVILQVGGVGYKVALTKETVSHFLPGSTVALFTHLAVREDALDLYGFESEEELRFFELLLTVSGIGPKSALAILDVADVETLRSAIHAGNAAYLTTVSGIGKKTAEKIVLELRDKIGAAIAGFDAALEGDAEALEAMKSLGYSATEAREALRRVPASITGANARLREALRVIGKQ
jgi:Holliday junction DNA helicase RuvA